MFHAEMIDSPLPDGDAGLHPAVPKGDFADSFTYAKSS